MRISYAKIDLKTNVRPEHLIVKNNKNLCSDQYSLLKRAICLNDWTCVLSISSLFKSSCRKKYTIYFLYIYAPCHKKKKNSLSIFFMARTLLLSLVHICSLIVVLISCRNVVAIAQNAELSYDFYSKSCPNVEKIIHTVVSQKLLEAPVTAAGALRIFFHDCFVEVRSILFLSLVPLTSPVCLH